MCHMQKESHHGISEMMGRSVIPSTQWLTKALTVAVLRLRSIIFCFTVDGNCCLSWIQATLTCGCHMALICVVNGSCSLYVFPENVCLPPRFPNNQSSEPLSLQTPTALKLDVQTVCKYWTCHTVRISSLRSCVWRSHELLIPCAFLDGLNISFRQTKSRNLEEFISPELVIWRFAMFHCGRNTLTLGPWVSISTSQLDIILGRVWPMHPLFKIGGKQPFHVS